MRNMGKQIFAAHMCLARIEEGIRNLQSTSGFVECNLLKIDEKEFGNHEENDEDQQGPITPNITLKTQSVE